MMKQFIIDSYNDWKIISDALLLYRIVENTILLFRGQNRDYYKLIPYISRNYTDSLVIKKYEMMIIDQFYKEISKINLNENFKRENTKYKFENEWYKLIQAQHINVPTRLMDWTLSADIALYFATCNNHKDDDLFDGQLWIYNCCKSDLIEYDREYLYQEISPYEIKDSFTINPSFQDTFTIEKLIEQFRVDDSLSNHMKKH